MPRFLDKLWPYGRTAFLYGVARAFALAAAGWFLASPPVLGSRNGMDILAPAQAVLTAALLLSHRSQWLTILAVTAAFNALGWKDPSHFSVRHEFAEMAQALVTASLVRTFAGAELRFDRLKQVGWFVLFAVVIGPATANLLVMDEWSQRVLNQAITSLSLVSAFSVWGAWRFERLAASSWARRAEACILGVSFVAVTLWVYAGPVRSAASLIPSLVLPVPFLLWAAVRFDPRAAVSALAAMSVTALYFSALGEGPFSHFSPIGNIRSLQLFLSVFAISVLCLAAVVRERHEAQRRLEGRLRLEEYLSGLSQHLYAEGASDTAVRRWLFALLDVLAVDRVSLIERRTNPEESYLEFAFSRGGIPPARPVSSRSDFPWISGRLQELQALVLNRLPDDLPGEAANERGFFIEHKVKSYVAIPVKLDASTRWTLSATAIRESRVWPPETVAQLRLVGETFGMAVARRRADEALRESEGQFRALFDEAPLGIAVTDSRGAIRRSNRALREMLGYTEEELRGQRLTSLAGEAPELLVFPGSPELRHEAWYSAKNRSLWCRLRASAIPGDSHESLVIAMLEDLTAPKAAESKVRSLTGQLITAQEEERRRLSRELHDDVNQQLAAASILLSSLKRYLPESEMQGREQFARVQSRLISIAAAIRSLSHGLHSAVLEHSGLVPALRGLCVELEQAHGIPCSFDLQPLEAELPREVSLSIYRVLQESLRNVARHSQSPDASVTLFSQDGWIEMSIADRGAGFDPSEARSSGGLGLVSMEERVRMLGGEFTVSSGKNGGGTLTRVRMPANAKAGRAEAM